MRRWLEQAFDLRQGEGGLVSKKRASRAVSSSVCAATRPNSVAPARSGFLARDVQATVAAVLFALAALDLATPAVLAAFVATLARAWLVSAPSLARPYVDQFRQALSRAAVLRPPFGHGLAS